MPEITITPLGNTYNTVYQPNRKHTKHGSLKTLFNTYLGKSVSSKHYITEMMENNRQ